MAASRISSNAIGPWASTIARTSSRTPMSGSSSKRSPMSRLRTSRCAVSSLGGEWRSSASRTTGQQLGRFQRSCCPCAHKIAHWSGIDPDAFAMALINEYRPGTPIGWHRDAPQYDIVAGISLLSACRMKFRPYRSPSAPTSPRRSATHEIVLDRRSAYLMTGESRQAYEHHIPPVATVALLGDVSHAPLIGLSLFPSPSTPAVAEKVRATRARRRSSMASHWRTAFASSSTKLMP